MSEPQTMVWQLVGHGDVIVMTVPGEVPITVTISDEAFVEAVGKLVNEAKPHPKSLLRRLRVENGR